jgi:putative transposase
MPSELFRRDVQKMMREGAQVVEVLEARQYCEAHLIGERLREIVRGAVEENGGELYAIETMPDHVHVVVGCDPSFGITRLVRLMKGRTSRLLRQEYRPLRSRVPTLWTNATFIATTGGAPLAAIKKYVEEQRGV